jgi:hypothetical protein
MMGSFGFIVLGTNACEKALTTKKTKAIARRECFIKGNQSLKFKQNRLAQGEPALTLALNSGCSQIVAGVVQQEVKKSNHAERIFPVIRHD